MNEQSFHRVRPVALNEPFVFGASTEKNRPDLNYAVSFDPEAYRHLSRYVQALGWNTLLDGARFLKGSSVLDLGFGHGGNLAHLARELHDIDCVVFGLDKSPDMVQSAQANYPSSEYPNLTFLEGSAETAGDVVGEYQRKSRHNNLRFACIVSNYTLHWVRDPLDPVKFLHREVFKSLNCLQPLEGEQRHFCAHVDAFKELFEAGYETMRRDSRWGEYFDVRPGDYSVDGEWRHPPLVTENGITSDLIAAGYRAKAEVRTDERVFPDIAMLKAWVGAMIRPFMNRIPEDRKSDFVEAWMRTYVELNPWALREDGSALLIDRNILVVAHKERELGA